MKTLKSKTLKTIFGDVKVFETIIKDSLGNRVKQVEIESLNDGFSGVYFGGISEINQKTINKIIKMENTHIKTEKEIYEKLFKFAEKTGLVKNGKYIDGIPQGKEEDIDLFYYWEDFLGYPSPEEVNNKLNKK